MMIARVMLIGISNFAVLQEVLAYSRSFRGESRIFLGIGALLGNNVILVLGLFACLFLDTTYFRKKQIISAGSGTHCIPPLDSPLSLWLQKIFKLSWNEISIGSLEKGRKM